MIRDHSAAELVSRLAQAKLVRRKTDPTDRRRSLVVMTGAGDRRLSELAAVHLKKLRETKGVFFNFFRTAAERRIARHFEIAFAVVRTGKADRTFPIGEIGSHPASRIERRRLDVDAATCDLDAPARREVAIGDAYRL